MKAFIASHCASRRLRIDNERTSQLAGVEERVASLEKEKAALEEALAAMRTEAKSNAEMAEAARQDARAAEEVKASAEKAKVEAEETRKIAEDACACEKDIIQRWRTTISSALDLVQADMHGLLRKFGLDPPEMSQEETVEVSELFRWIRASVKPKVKGKNNFTFQLTVAYIYFAPNISVKLFLS